MILLLNPRVVETFFYFSDFRPLVDLIWFILFCIICVWKLKLDSNSYITLFLRSSNIIQWKGMHTLYGLINFKLFNKIDLSGLTLLTTCNTKNKNEILGALLRHASHAKNTGGGRNFASFPFSLPSDTSLWHFLSFFFSSFFPFTYFKYSVVSKTNRRRNS